MDVLNSHVSIRKFSDRKINPILVKSLLYSGTKASTTGNMQWYSIVVSETFEDRNALIQLHFNQTAAKNAQLFLTFIADLNRFNIWCKIGNAKAGYDNFLSFFTAAIDALLVAQNVCIAAENNGLGICYLGTTIYNAKEIINVLNLPMHTFPVTTIAIGYPDELPESSDRIPITGIVHNGRYKNYSESEVRELYSYKENLELYKAFIKENKKETLAQVFTDVRYKKDDNEFFSEKMLEALKEQGFLE